ncbi:substrate-binding domain-containing protein [Nostoc sp.]|uniref:substrate-binding domain-containing protein n=1 Tax=Nostoc sp. TaxID=1180 RepID=UPI002FF747F1
MAFYRDRQLTHLASSISVFAITIGLVVGQSATQKSLAQTSTTPAPSGVTSINGSGGGSVNTLLVGTGTTSPYAPKGSWFNTYGVGNPKTLNPPGPVNPLVTWRYAAINSSAGVAAFFTQTPPPLTATNTATILRPVSFADTDDPITGTEKLSPGPNAGIPIQVPVITYGVSLAYNPTGLNVPAGGIKLSRATYLGIFNGTITNWNDAKIKADNGGRVIAVNKPIVVVRRSDNSANTFTLSNNLRAAFGATWNRGVGEKSIAQPASGIPNPLPANTVVWPANFQSAAKSGGVATKIKTTAGAIGYVDNSTRLANGLQAAVLQNKAGTYNPISSTSIRNAFVGATDQDPSPRRIKIVVTDPTAANAYPLVSASYLLFYDKYADVKIANGIKGFIGWALGTTAADNIATARGYAPLPDAIKTQSKGVVNSYVNNALNP